MHKRDRQGILLTGISIVILLLAGCQSGAEAGTGETTGGDTGSVGTTSGGSTGGEAVAPPLPEGPVSSSIVLDPAGNSDETARAIDSAIYETLIVTNASGESSPALAQSWVVSDDTLDYIFTLRSGVTFHDGTPVNADAVIANFTRWFDPASSLRGSGSYQPWADAFGGFQGEMTDGGSPKSSFDGIEKVDDLTVLVHLNRPQPDLLMTLADISFGIASPIAIEASGDTYGTASGSAVGTGPYKVGAWTASSLTLDPNTSYWGEVPADTKEFPLQ